MYQVRLEKFEGPMELLLDLIEKEQLAITELSLAKIADGYLEYIRNNGNINLEHLAEFLVVASRLILIKSRALLPVFTVTEEEEQEIEDLTHQLEEYKKFKEAAAKLSELVSFNKIAYSRSGFPDVMPVFYPPSDLGVYDLRKYYLSVVAEIPVIEKLQEEIVSEVVTLEERINEIEGMLRERIQTSFGEFVGKAQDKIEIIVSFLAVLEMVKQRIICVEQDDLFREIKINLKGN